MRNIPTTFSGVFYIPKVLKCQKHSLDDDSVAFLRELKERLENDIVKACAPDE